MAETIDNDAFSRRRRRRFFIIVGAAVLATIVGVALLMNIFERKQEARNPFYRVVELTDDTDDPAIWGKNFPLQYDDYKRTVDQVRTRYGGSEALPHTPTKADPRSVVSQSKIEEDPRLKVMWAGYAFAKDFREERGHAYMLDDQTFTEREQVVQAARHVHSMPRLGLRALQEGGQRRSHRGLREIQSDALLRGAQAGLPSGGLHRLPRSEHHAAAGHASRVHRRHPRVQGHPGRAELRRQHAGDAPGDARLRLRPVPRRVLLQGHRRSGSTYPVGQGAQGRTRSWLTTTRAASRTGRTPTPARRCSRRSTRSSRCGTRASTRARAWPAPIATCPTSARAR